MTTLPAKRKRAPRRELEPLESIDAKDGPKMLALPSDRHRAFVRALYTVRPGHGAAVKAAKIAGFGTTESSPQSMATIASRLKHDERILEAIEEEDKKFIRASAPRGISALSRLIEDPRHKDHARGIDMVLSRVHPVEQIHNVKHNHDVTPAFQNTAQVLARMAELAAKYCVPAPSLPAPVVIENDESVMQVTAEYVEEVCRANIIPIKYTVVIISGVKRMLASDIPDEWRLKFLERLDHMAADGNDRWLTADMIAAIEPMCDRDEEIYSEAAKLDRGKPGRPGMLDALAKFFPAFAVLNPSLMTALELEPRRNGYFRSATGQPS